MLDDADIWQRTESTVSVDKNAHSQHTYHFFVGLCKCSVFVLDDGGETDLDLGNYERFLSVR